MQDENMEVIKVQENLPPKKEDDSRFSIREKMTAVLIAVLLGMFFDYLFYSNNIGISHPIFSVLLIGYFLYTAKDRINYKNRIGWFTLGITAILSISFAVHTNGFLSVLNFLAVPFLIVIYTILVTNDKVDWLSLSFVEAVLTRIFFKAIPNAFKPLTFIKDFAARKKGIEKNKTRKNILIGLGISLPILMFVIPLLASADMAFGYYLKNISKAFDFISLNEAPIHVILVLFVSLYVFGYAWSFKYKDTEKYPLPKTGCGRVDPTIIITVLIVVNLVYLMFTSVQFSYLYGGAGNVLQGEFTYAEYARRGFFELLDVTIINFIILTISLKFVKRDSIKLNKFVNILLSLLVGFTFNMLFSAFSRLSLYEESYGFTTLRIYVHTFMLLMFVLFIIALAGIWYKKIPIFKASIICTALFYAALNFMNVDGMAARRNVERYVKSGVIDVHYLNTLSYDAIPEIIKLADDKNETVAREIREGLQQRYKNLNDDSRWMEYNYSKSRAARMLGEYFNNN